MTIVKGSEMAQFTLKATELIKKYGWMLCELKAYKHNDNNQIELHKDINGDIIIKETISHTYISPRAFAREVEKICKCRSFNVDVNKDRILLTPKENNNDDNLITITMTERPSKEQLYALHLLENGGLKMPKEIGKMTKDEAQSIIGNNAAFYEYLKTHK